MSDTTIHKLGESDLQTSFRVIVIGACALASWAAVILIGLGLARLFGY
jgi:hypothetical protein